jgi:hypothetical protein
MWHLPPFQFSKPPVRSCRRSGMARATPANNQSHSWVVLGEQGKPQEAPQPNHCQDKWKLEIIGSPRAQATPGQPGCAQCSARIRDKADLAVPQRTPETSLLSGCLPGLPVSIFPLVWRAYSCRFFPPARSLQPEAHVSALHWTDIMGSCTARGRMARPETLHST